jgi:hypothetical protein
MAQAQVSGNAVKRGLRVEDKEVLDLRIEKAKTTNRQ